MKRPVRMPERLSAAALRAMGASYFPNYERDHNLVLAYRNLRAFLKRAQARKKGKP